MHEKEIRFLVKSQKIKRNTSIEYPLLTLKYNQNDISTLRLT